MDELRDDTENVAASLVREYLSRKGLKQTIQALDDELPRTKTSISNRLSLAKSLGVEKLMRKNKDLSTPHRTILEVITRHFVEKLANKTSTNKQQNDSVRQSVPMYQRYQREGGSAKTPANNDDMVLEDAEEGETVLGGGNVAEQRPPSGRVITSQQQQRSKRKQLSSSGPICSNLNECDKQISKRQLKQLRDNLDSRTESAKPEPTEPPRPRSGSDRTNRETVKNKTLEIGKTKAEQKETEMDQIRTEERPRKPEQEMDQIRTEERPRKPEQSPKKDEMLNVIFNDPTPATKKLEAAEPKKPKTRAELLTMLVMADPRNGGEGGVTSSPAKTAPAPKAKQKQEERYNVSTRLGDLELGDVEDEDLMETDMLQPAPAKLTTGVKYQSRPIELETAKELKRLIFGTTLQQFYEEWRDQGLTFSDQKQVRYGIVQRKGGPCGVLAAVQACCIQDLLFGADKEQDRRRLSPGRSERTESLVMALSTIL